jgi:trans-aconitate 2-methyltransferase
MATNRSLALNFAQISWTTTTSHASPAAVPVRAQKLPTTDARERTPGVNAHERSERAGTAGAGILDRVSRDWDARTYDAIAAPQERWGRSVLGRLRLAGDERVLDAGCGSGRVTEELARRLPRGHVVALDASPSMIEAARERLDRFGDRVEYVVADLGAALPVDPPVDAIVSTATFHWVADHDALFRNLAAVLRPGGRLVAQFGGDGNVQRLMDGLAAVGDGWLGPAHFETPEATERRLRAAGFEEVRCWLQPEPTWFEPGEPFERFLETVALGPQLDRLAPEDRPLFVHQVVARLGEPFLDYVRLNVDARRGGATVI